MYSVYSKIQSKTGDTKPQKCQVSMKTQFGILPPEVSLKPCLVASTWSNVPNWIFHVRDIDWWTNLSFDNPLGKRDWVYQERFLAPRKAMIGNICSGNIKNCKHVKHIQMKFSCICVRETTSIKTALMKSNPQAQIRIPFEKIA
jgi:hypothetical protein